MIKTSIQQVSLVKEALKKTPDNNTPATVPPAAPPAGDMSAARQANTQKFKDLFNQMNEHSVAGRTTEAHGIKGKIKDLAMNAPKGSIDVGKLGMMRERQLEPPDARKPLTHADMTEVINHHLSDVRNLKDIHQNHGGDDTIRTLMHTMGANGEPKQYSNIKFNKPGIHEDLLDLVFPGKADWDRTTQRHLGVPSKAPFANTAPDPKLEEEVGRTWDDVMDVHDMHDGSPSSEARMKAHENAVVKRGLDLLRRHANLTDKIADLKSGGSLHYNTGGNYEIRHPKGNVHAWHDDSSGTTSYNQHRDDNQDGTGFTEDIAASKPIQDHIDEAIDAIKKHRKHAKY